ncbi:BTB/POZ domain-containing protein KCTD21-like [Patiria miniata]|uniref:BTB domain-containing protein n=1 Tax=Patiria miniata TaxID=46514 RepID=A0A913ZJ46_PATMI|nr:BTB/POZ domain-containing protein KCTD21-like [Patiria miniata]
MDDMHMVDLNVGGCLYTTSRSNLTRYPDSMLAAMFSSELDPSVRNANGAYVIDGDGPIFRHVLNFLRRGKLNLPEDFKEWDLLTSEADFYQVGDLTDAVMAEKMRRVTPEDSSKSPKFEFVEINLKKTTMGIVYIGSMETLANLPVIVAFFKTDPYSNGDVLDVVKQQGMIQHFSSSYLYSEEPIGDKRMIVFREIAEHGFELKAVLYDSYGNKEWTFARKV